MLVVFYQFFADVHILEQQLRDGLLVVEPALFRDEIHLSGVGVLKVPQDRVELLARDHVNDGLRVHDRRAIPPIVRLVGQDV